MASTLDDIRIIDVDTHVIEPPDLWTSRVDAKWGDRRPHVRWDPATGRESWFIGDAPITGVGTSAMAGWAEYPPAHPRTWDEIDPVMWDAKARLAMMDGYGIESQILYPNVLLFHSGGLQDADARSLQLECVQAYNDFLSEWSEVAPKRLIPMSSLPFWDLEATLAEVQRCARQGHRGVIFTQDPSYFGLPALADVHWDPLWALTQELGLPVNFHIGSADASFPTPPSPQTGPQAAYAAMGVSFFMANARTVAQLITGGICHRFPELNFVSVESGIGWIPYFLESLDWQWANFGPSQEHPDFSLARPSEYFHRQIYASFWFEQASARFALDILGPDNVFYETDFPHPTCQFPGPATIAVTPREYIETAIGDLPEATLRKILHDNAARIYHIG